MHRLALAPLALSAGCLLYTGDLNHPPVITGVDLDVAMPHKGQLITFTIASKDEEDGIDVARVGQPTITHGDDTPLGDCDGGYESSFGNSFAVRFYREGTYKVTAKVIDSQNAESTGYTTMITVSNAPPKFDSGSTITLGPGANTCGNYIAGEGITLALTGNASDGDGPLTSPVPGCAGPEMITYTWSVTPAGAGHPVLTSFSDNGGCAAPTKDSGASLTTTNASDKVCVWPDYGTSAAPAMYDLKLTVSDGEAQDSITSSFGVVADGPPCLTGLSPPDGMYVVDPNNPAPFDRLSVTAVADALDSLGQIKFFWKLWRETDPVWRDIPLSTSANTYTPDYASFGVGELVKVRVIAVDRTNAMPSCPDTMDSCPVVACVSNCNQWITWDLELR
jgi:hypothetical protein